MSQYCQSVLSYPLIHKSPSIFKSFIGSASFHFFAIISLTVIGVEHAQYSMSDGNQAVEITLVSSQPEEQPEELFTQQIPDIQAPLELPQPDDIVVKKELPIANKPKVIKPISKAKKIPIVAQQAVPSAGSADRTEQPGAITKQQDISAAYLNNPPPTYPPESRRLREQGTVLLKVSITEQGKVSDLNVETSSGFYKLDQAAIKAVRRWVFRPTTVAGVAIADTVKVPIRFLLKD